MDAYDLVQKVKQIWMENYDKNSGSIQKSDKDIEVMINGKPVTSIEFKDGHIELRASNDKETI